MKLWHWLAVVVWSIASVTWADGPKDNQVDDVRRIPKLGVEVTEADRKALEADLKTLAGLIEQVRQKASKDKDTFRVDLLPDVEIYYRAAHDALKYQEFFAPPEIERGKEQLQTGIQRAYELLEKRASWTTQTGLVVRGYRSKLDGTAQPYGLVVPATFQAGAAHKHRLDLWFHGRGETLSEVAFIDQRSKQVGQFAPADTFVLHTYGRYSNAFKLAGEIDVLEAMESVQKRYPIDRDRLVVRGFSMGGAGAWHFAVHYPTLWAAANPGAGFSETPEFLRVFQSETLSPTPYERKLWQMYDCTEYARNLYHCPTVAYSGDEDRQKQAADIMVDYAAKEGLRLTHIIGPKTGHKYHPDAAAEVERRLASIVARGRQPMPREVHFTTYTLRYNEAGWLRIDGLGEHWARAQVDGRIVDESHLQLTTRNVTGLTLQMPSGWSPFNALQPVELAIDGQQLSLPGPETDRSWNVSLHRAEKKWIVGSAPIAGLAKTHLLQGPIDDALLDSFVFVRPTGKPMNEALGKWAQSEFDHAVEHWRRQMRGVARVVDDTKLDDATIASANLVLWGDPASNSVLANIADKLPIRWSNAGVEVGKQSFAAEHHAPVLVYPNPLNPQRYVVLNSSFTYREYDYLNNARQVPKLPDWAVVDIRTPPNSRFPGKIVAADFFDEQWRVK
jgi:hypothetical protein